MSTDNLLKHEQLSKNTLWNLVSHLLPVLAAFLVIPALLRQMGTDRFGLLTICWMISGYFSLLDFGIGKALTQKIAGNIVGAAEKQISDIIKNALISTMLISGILALVLIVLTNTLINDVLQVTGELARETQISFLILALSLPLVIGSASLRGILESIQRFDLVNVVKVPTSTLSFVFAYLTLNFTTELHWVLASLVVLRALTFFFYWFFCARIFPAIRGWRTYAEALNWRHISSLLKVGGWMTVSNVISPIMVQMDRFFISHIMTISVVAHYTAPYEMVSKIQILTGAVTGVLFPALATSLVSQTKLETHNLLNKGMLSVISIVFPAVLFLILFAQEILKIWLGDQMPLEATLITQVLAIGFFFNSMANVPFALIQADNRPDITAKIHCFELIIYIPIIWILVTTYGLAGAAIAWSLRSLIDLVLLTYFEHLLIGGQRLYKTGVVFAITFIPMVSFVYFATALSLELKIVLQVALAIAAAVLFLRLSKQNRIFFLSRGS